MRQIPFRLHYLTRPHFYSLRYRLLALVLVPLLILSGTVILLAAKWSSDYTYEQLFAKVHADLQVSAESFARIQEDARWELSSAATSAALANTLAKGSAPDLMSWLKQQREQRGFDFLRAWSSDGRQVLTRTGWREASFHPSPSTREILSSTLSRDGSKGVVGIELYQPDAWLGIPGLDASRVVLPLVPTARAVPSERVAEERAMVIRTLQRVLDNRGERVALLEGGILLNRNFDFVDKIRDLVYGPGSLMPGSRGTVTVFVDDVRISTNVPSRDDTRALGTRVSREVFDAVLSRGEQWIDRAYVVNDWYISAYQPIIDVSGNRVGMLYAGYLEAPFRSELVTAIAVLSVLVIAGSLLAGLAAIQGARGIFTPIETMTSVVRATAAGKHRRIGSISPGSEIGELATQFDSMLDTLESNRRRIEQDAGMLEDKVRHRTAELEQQNQKLKNSIELLQQTRRQLANAEKLAALGELTAGVAHEINNPTAVILGNMDVLVADLGDGCNTVQTEIDLIYEQVYRIRSITDRLLQYSRSDQSPAGLSDEPRFLPGQSPLTPVSLPLIMQDSLTLLAHELNGRSISVTQNHRATLAALIDRQELQQVLINLLGNAIQAIGKGGQIHIDTCDVSDESVSMRVRDSGCGIDPADLPRVFDPFFTSGKASGTGLGLSVSYGIVRRFGGDIQVRSEIGVGSVFEIVLTGVADTT